MAGCSAAPDPVAAGIAAAVAEARALLAVDGVAGVNLSGLASGARRGARGRGQGRGRARGSGRSGGMTGPATRRWRPSSTSSPRWTEEAVAAARPGPRHPGGLPGQRQPGGLPWLAEALGLRAGARLLDAGAGVGGPAALRRAPVRGAPGAGRADAGGLPRPRPAVRPDRGGRGRRRARCRWPTGVRSTPPGASGCCARRRTRPALLRRAAPGAAAPAGRLGLLVFTARRGRLPDPPQGNDFPTDDEVARLLDDSGFDLVQQLEAAEVAATPLSWTERIEAVERAVADAHGDDPRFALARDQEQRVARLLDEGRVAGRLVHAVAR